MVQSVTLAPEELEAFGTSLDRSLKLIRTNRPSDLNPADGVYGQIELTTVRANPRCEAP